MSVVIVLSSGREFHGSITLQTIPDVRGQFAHNRIAVCSLLNHSNKDGKICLFGEGDFEAGCPNAASSGF